MKDGMSYHNRRFVELLEEKTRRRISVPRSRRIVRAGPSVPRPRGRTVSHVIPSGKPSKAGPRAICNNLYDYLQRSALILAPERDEYYGSLTEIVLNDEGSEKQVLADEAYNSFLLFSFIAYLVDEGTIFYQGTPGSSKTSAAKLIAHYLYGIPLQDIERATIKGHEGITDTDMLAMLDMGILIKEGREEPRARPFVKSMVRILDEVNRLSKDARNVLYSIASDGEAEYRGRIFTAPPGPLITTANYIDQANSELEAPFKDRLDIQIETSTFNPFYIELFRERKQKNLRRALKDIAGNPRYLTAADLRIAKHEINSIKFSEEAMAKFAYFLAEANYCTMVRRDVNKKKKGLAAKVKPGNELCGQCHYAAGDNICYMSPDEITSRSIRAIFNFSAGLAWWRGKSEVGIEELRAVVPYALSHKLSPTEKAKKIDGIYVNDGPAFVHDMFEKAERNYELVVQKAPIVKKLAKMVYDAYKFGAQSGIDRDEVLEKLKDEVPNIDSPAKFAFSAALTDLLYVLK